MSVLRSAATITLGIVGAVAVLAAVGYALAKWQDRRDAKARQKAQIDWLAWEGRRQHQPPKGTP